VRRRWWQAVVVVAVAALAAACGSSGSGNGGGGSAASASPYKIGLLVDATGTGGAVWSPAVLAVKGAFNSINSAGGVDGRKLDYVTADTASSASGALTAVQDLVEKDKVFAILSLSNYFYGAVQYAKQAGVPVVGAGSDGPEWDQPVYTNLFNVQGNRDVTAIIPFYGPWVKDKGGTVCGSIGASNIPIVTTAAQVFVASCEKAGLKGTVVNTNLPYDSTDIGAIALQWKSAGVNAAYLVSGASTSFALLTRPKQLGVQLKAVLFSGGYGQATLADPAQRVASQGLTFPTATAPIEMNTAATQHMETVFAAVGIKGIPSVYQDSAYDMVQGLLVGLQKAGKDASQAQFIAALRKVTDFNDGGLYSPGVVNFSNYSSKSQCQWFVTLEGDKFVPDPHDPFCGTATADIPAS
jgi:branched-chain amino acid transport system substrate-binding protein